MEMNNNLICSILETTVMSISLHPVRLTPIFTDFDRLEICEHYFVEREEEETEIASEFIKNIKWDTVLFPDITKLVVKNSEPEYSTLQYEKSTPTGVTVKDIADGVFRVKSQKDDWFDGENYNQEIKDGCLTITVKFYTM